MRVISRRQLEAFVQRHPRAKVSLDAWYQVVKQAQWKTFAEVRRTYPSADVVGRLTVFNVGGNLYRVITRINYQRQIVFIGYVLTHADYDKGDWNA